MGDYQIGQGVVYKPNEEVLKNHFRTDKQTFNKDGNPAIVVGQSENGYILNVFTVHGVVVIENWSDVVTEPLKEEPVL
jgi:hypothetical protein